MKGFVGVTLVAWLSLPIVAQAGDPQHLVDARELLDRISPASNSYGSPPEVTWPARRGPKPFNQSMCSSFLALLLQHSYAMSPSEMSKWTGSASPLSSRWHDTIADENGFLPVTRVSDLLPGDVLAIAYWDEDASSSGHTALIDGPPIDLGLDTVKGRTLRHYEVLVLDVVEGGHGDDDTRELRTDKHGVPDTGIGAGRMRIYADPVTDEIAGYAWSDRSWSTIYLQPPNDPASLGRHVVVGRL